MSQQWKAFERRIAVELGGRRSGPLGAAVSDIVGVPWAVECKYTTRYSLRHSWIEQARLQSKREGNPWLLVIAEHYDRFPICVHALSDLVELGRQAGKIPPLEIAEEGSQ